MKILIAILVTLVNPLAANANDGDSCFKLRTSETHPSDYPTTQGLAYMGELLNEWSDGCMTMKLYAGGQLGEEKDTLEITIFGGIDLNRINMAPLTSVVAETSVLGLPFLFRSIDHLRATVDSEIGDEILSYLEPHDLIGLAFYDSGARSFYNNVRPIHSPDDLKGMKIRVQNSSLAVAMVKALGGNPTPMGFGQVYGALLLGTIEGSENNWPSYQSTRHYEVASHYTLTRHTMMPEILVMSKHSWNKLSVEQQTLIRLAAKASVPYMRKQWDKRVKSAQKKVLAAGAQVIQEPNLEPFFEAMQPVYQQFISSDKMQVLVNRIRAVKVPNSATLNPPTSNTVGSQPVKSQSEEAI